MKIWTYMAPPDIRPGELDEKAAVVIDTLRMTSVACVAMANGCDALFTCAEIEEARNKAAECGALLGGERKALKIEGFDFSNSPLEYTRDAIEGRRLVMSTSNGTKAIEACAAAKRILLGSLLNVDALTEKLRGEAETVLVCAGTLNRFTLEDVLTAGAIIESIGDAELMNDSAIAALMLYRSAKDNLTEVLSQTGHYNKLKKLGFDGDLTCCLTVNGAGAVCERQSDGWFRRV